MNKQTSTGSTPSLAGRSYWQSFEHLANSPEIAEAINKEFPTYDPTDIAQMSRRRFMKYIAASLALAGVGLSGCRRWPEQVLAPYSSQPKDRIPGVPEYYATSWELGGIGTGLLVSSYDGRPIKIEGNPSHPGSVTRSGQWGSADQYAQAQTLSLYDPDRSRAIIDRSGGQLTGRSVEWFRQNVVPQLTAFQNNGGRLAILSEGTSSPTVQRLREQLQSQYGGSTWYTWEPLETGGEAAATQQAFGQRLRPIYHFNKADVVVSFDEDYLGLHPAHTRYAADWSVRRASVDTDHPEMSRCYQAETRYSITGASTDVRLPVRPSRLPVVMRALASLLEGGEADQASLTEEEREWIAAAAVDLQDAGQNALVVAGRHLPSELQALGYAMNQRLGSIGNTISFIPDPVQPGGQISDLVARMQQGEIEALVILGGNPAYDAPADLNFAEALARVPLSVHLSLYDDETSALSTFHVPRAHFLEAWGDTRAWDGTIAPIQPLILPLFNGLSSIEILALLLGQEADGYSLVRETMRPMLEGELDRAFRRVLHDGVVQGSAAQPVQVGAPNVPTVGGSAPAEENLEVVFAGDLLLYDGRFANNGWLQEVPETMTKLTWDNAALMSIFDAERLGVRTTDWIAVAVNGRQLQIPVYVMPGQPKGVVGLVLGYGRRRAGAIGTAGSADPTDGGGFDTYQLRTTNALWYANGAQVQPLGGRYPLAMTQNHHIIDEVGYEGREARVGDKGRTSMIIRETTFPQHQEFVEHAHQGQAAGGHSPHGPGYPANEGQHGAVSLQIFKPPHEFNDPYAWGMTIDMTTCIGCSACVVACNAENNIPVVGKNMVLNNREMHWLRIDRYFKAEGEDYDQQIHDPNPDVALQPMMCVHCENAPCEQVCPVAATLHDSEGLNTMVYNRCIGTRYCSNNCPYKVRRFNYVDYFDKDPRGGVHTATYLGMPDQQLQEIDAIKRMVFNPEVTVRMRGVMEKCTYCTQRINLKKIWRNNRGEEIQDGDIKTACQMACPTESIIFGNLNDATARATRQQQLPRAYAVLGELNTRPRTKHLARLRNRLEAGEAMHGHETTEETVGAAPEHG